MQVIDLRTDLLKVRKAFDEKKLTAFQDGGRCEYVSSDGCNCAVGAMFNAETIDLILKSENLLNAKRVGVLLHERVLQATPDEQWSIIMLQRLHDGWLNGYGVTTSDLIDLRSIGFTSVEDRDLHGPELFNKFLTFLERKFQ